MNYRRVPSTVVVGAVVVLVGLALLLRTTNVYDTAPLLRYVPTLFVLVGAYALVASGFRNLAGPVLVIVVAGAWQLVTLGVVEGATLLDFWPVLIVLFGLSIAFGQLRPRPIGTDAAYIDGFALFGGIERRATSRTFRRADLTAIFGSATLDLRDVERPAPGEPPVRVRATALFGGVEVVAPREWHVHLDALPIFGATEDDRLRVERAPEEADRIDLVVDGFVAFGGISVTD